MSDALAVLSLAWAQLAIGAAAIFARFALTAAGPVAVSALRLSIAACVAIAIVGRFRRVSRRREAARSHVPVSRSACISAVGLRRCNTRRLRSRRCS